MSTHSREADSLAAETAPRLETERVEACPVCSSTASKTWRTDCRDWLLPDSPDRFEFDRCTACGARYLAVRPRESEVGKLYFTGYGPYQTVPSAMPAPPRPQLVTRLASPPLRVLGAGIGLVSGRRLARKLEWAYTPEADGETLVDYGCGAPTFLDNARARGFATVGVDFTEDVLGVVREHGHRAHLVGEDFERNVADGAVGCVRMNHVIEHLYHPREALEIVRRKLRPGGRIHIATPNPSSIGARVFGRRWHPPLDAPRHVVLYPPPLLRSLLGELGFRDVSVAQEAAPKDLARSWGVVLYDRGRIEHEQIAGMAGDATRFGVLLPVATLGALVSAADRFHVFARRA
jgi:SAM-dependent methyltransferase